LASDADGLKTLQHQANCDDPPVGNHRTSEPTYSAA
jgi:hypothetical protein